jgi:hypothetical protein
MSDLADALAICIEAMEEHEAEDATLARRIRSVRATLEDLQLDLDCAVN